MATHRPLSSAIQRAAIQAQAQTVTVSQLLTLYLAATNKQREEQFASTSHAAEIVGVSQRTIQLWIEIGALLAVRVGRNYRVSLDSLFEWLRNQIDR